MISSANRRTEATKAAPRPHDLLRIDASTLIPDDSVSPQEWVSRCLRRTPWVVVRWSPANDEVVAVGVRGDDRSQRFAAWVPLSAINQILSPEDLVGHIDVIDPDFAVAKAAKSASDLFKAFGLTWGVTGSVGFTLATGVNTIHATSDLDLVVRVSAETVIGDREWRHISTSLASLPSRVDARISAPIGEISLDEYVAAASEPVLVRTAEGPKLISDPLGAR